MDVVETLFAPLEQNFIEWRGKHILFLNASLHENLKEAQFDLQHYFPIAKVKPDVSTDKIFDGLLLLFPKNIAEGRYELARGLKTLKSDGFIVMAADNKAGGARLKKIAEEFGFNDIQELSKNKARVVWSYKKHVKDDIIGQALEAGAPQAILGGQYISQAGIFGWDKIDNGSEILARILPEFHGKGADFGCGYGYLSCIVLERSKNANLICIDADYRAVEACRQNVGNRAQCEWRDLTQAQPDIKGLDFIVMNPPFHEGKMADHSIGVSFIRNASLSLKKGGKLWMVANTHLPYEDVLKQLFESHREIIKKQGFKVFEAVK